MRWLALDIGSRRVGVAICDDGERVVTPLEPLEFGGAAALAVAVTALARSREVAGVVVGVPITIAGTSRGEQRVAGVVDELRRRLDVPVVTEDERGTTAEATRRLESAGVPPSRRSGLVDSLAAQIILESHLERLRRTPPHRG